MWQLERVVDGKPTLTPQRVSLVVTKRGDRWLIAQFHNSPWPKPR
jgi:ketosteroid isomerase-like protein